MNSIHMIHVSLNWPFNLYSISDKSFWRQISELNTDADNDQPFPRSGAHCLSFENSIFFFGGYTRKGGTYFNDLTEFKTL